MHTAKKSKDIFEMKILLGTFGADSYSRSEGFSSHLIWIIIVNVILSWRGQGWHDPRNPASFLGDPIVTAYYCMKEQGWFTSTVWGRGSRPISSVPNFLILLFFSLLTYLSLDKMAAILQMIFSDAFLWMKMYEFWLKFHWGFLFRVQLIIFQHWFR